MIDSKYEVLRLTLENRDAALRHGNRFDLSTLNHDKLQRKKVTIDSSEMVRMIQAVNPSDNCSPDGGKYPFIRDIVELDVGNKTTEYLKLADTSGLIYIDDVPYRRLCCSSSDSRSRKAWFCAEAQWSKMHQIMRPGMSANQTFTASKVNAYDGLIHSSSTPVTMPNIVVVPDREAEIYGLYDFVYQDPADGSYRVRRNRRDKTSISLFDGGGLVTVDMAKQWKKDLGKKYLPAAFQFRAIPGIKGVLFTFDIHKFAKQHNCSTITDVWGKSWNLWKDQIDVIMTSSQFKYRKLYSSMEDWKDAFDTVEFGYRRTFNITTVSENPTSLKHKARVSYQHLQTLRLTKEDIRDLATPTVDHLKKCHSDVKAFLKYRGIDGSTENSQRIADWKRIPPYYRALSYNHDLCRDPFIQSRYKEDLKSAVRDACAGKLAVAGNYQILAPDIFALAQHAFGLEVTGLLEANEIYSQYWLRAEKHELDLLRNPHVAQEHNLVAVASTTAMQEWYQYQTATIITSTKDTIALRCNSADFDGDTVLTTSNYVLLRAVRRSASNTIIPPKNTAEPIECGIDKISALIEADKKAMDCDIGSVVNAVSKLWSLVENKDPASQVQDYIAIMAVVASTVIDAAKTGEVVAVPKNISTFLEEAKWPRFLKYRKDKATRKNEPKKKYDGTQSCTMNRVCEFVESHTKDLRVGGTTDPFDFTMLMSSEPYCYGNPYQRVRKVLLDLQKIYNGMSQHRSEDDGLNRRQYDCFFSRCRTELLYANQDINTTLDIVIALFYTDRDFARYHNLSILWNAFEDEMVNRAKGDFSAKQIDNKRLLRKHKRAQAELEKMRASNSEHTVDFSSINVYESDVELVSNTVSDLYARKVMLVTLVLSRIYDGTIVIQKKAKKGAFSWSKLSDLTGVPRRRIESILEKISDSDVLSIRCQDGRCELSFADIQCCGDVLCQPETVSDMRQGISDFFPGKTDIHEQDAPSRLCHSAEQQFRVELF